MKRPLILGFVLGFALLCATTVLVIVGCVLVAPSAGSLGVATVVAIGYIFVNTARAFLIRRLYRFSVGRWADLLPPLFATAIFLGSRELGELLLGRNLVGLVAISALGTLGCFATYYALLLTKEEKEYLRSAALKLVAACRKSVGAISRRSQAGEVR